jgi:hypothetical protein
MAKSHKGEIIVAVDSYMGAGEESIVKTMESTEGDIVCEEKEWRRKRRKKLKIHVKENTKGQKIYAAVKTVTHTQATPIAIYEMRRTNIDTYQACEKPSESDKGCLREIPNIEEMFQAARSIRGSGMSINYHFSQKIVGMIFNNGTCSIAY